MSEEKKYVDWAGLNEYTKEFKEWIWKLFRKVHARIGHVEEELAQIRKNTKVDYELIEAGLSEGKYEYVLYETITGEEHGRISIDISGNIHTVNWYDGESTIPTGEFTRIYRWEGDRNVWSSNTVNKWSGCLVFGIIHENDGTITRCIWAGNNTYSYEIGNVYWDNDEIDINGISQNALNSL